MGNNVEQSDLALYFGRTKFQISETNNFKIGKNSKNLFKKFIDGKNHVYTKHSNLQKKKLC